MCNVRNFRWCLFGISPDILAFKVSVFTMTKWLAAVLSRHPSTRVFIQKHVVFDCNGVQRSVTPAFAIPADGGIEWYLPVLP